MEGDRFGNAEALLDLVVIVAARETNFDSLVGGCASSSPEEQ